MSNEVQENMFFEGNGIYRTSELDFMGDDPYEAAAAVAEMFSCKIEVISLAHQNDNGCPTFRFYGKQENIIKVLEVYLGE